MAQTLTDRMSGALRETGIRSETRADNLAYQAYQILHIAFIVVPILAGIDKFLHVLTNWDMYLSPTVARLSPIPTHELMLIVGAIEIIAGLLVAVKPKIGAYVVCAWLVLIIVNLLLIPSYFDLALRDFGLALSAFALGRLSQRYSS